MATKKNFKKSNIALGKNIERLRLIKNMSPMQLGRKINQTKQQILRYECGTTLVRLSMLESIACALDEPIPKKIIRKMSIVRKLEVENDTEMADELIALYNQALPVPDDTL
jgi:transcriptional regulator with XRE-family HTH domain